MVSAAAALLGVVVPARNEAALLPACLAALRTAIAHPGRAGAPVRLVVVADGCTDGTAGVARAGGAVVLGGGEVGRGNVGAARDAGVRELLAEAGRAGVPPERLWVATTDADSTVPPDWLLLHETAAASGVDAVVGTVAVGDWTGSPPHVAAAFDAAYTAWQGAGARAPARARRAPRRPGERLPRLRRVRRRAGQRGRRPRAGPGAERRHDPADAGEPGADLGPAAATGAWRIR